MNKMFFVSTFLLLFQSIRYMFQAT